MKKSAIEPKKPIAVKRTAAKAERIALYPGSFDPPTVGHLDILNRALRMDIFDKVIVAIAYNPAKQGLFTFDERKALLGEAIGAPFAAGRVEVVSFQGLLVDYARAVRATAIIRGLRAVSDYEYELQMAHMNHRLYPDAETVFLMARDEFSYVSSRLIKEVATFGGDVTQFVPVNVHHPLLKKLGKA